MVPATSMAVPLVGQYRLCLTVLWLISLKKLFLYTKLSQLYFFSQSYISGVYFACIMIMCTISVIMTVLVLNFHHRNPDMYEMPMWVSSPRIRVRCYNNSVQGVSHSTIWNTHNTPSSHLLTSINPPSKGVIWLWYALRTRWCIKSNKVYMQDIYIQTNAHFV